MPPPLASVALEVLDDELAERSVRADGLGDAPVRGAYGEPAAATGAEVEVTTRPAADTALAHRTTSQARSKTMSQRTATIAASATTTSTAAADQSRCRRRR